MKCRHLILAIVCWSLPAVWCVLCSSPSRVWDAEHIVATADSLDAVGVLYTDTTALRTAIRALDKPVSKALHRNTLATAYYYLGRNLEDNYAMVADAAACYIACDRLHPDDPVRRGRVNACMAYICTWQCNDSLALVFLKRSTQAFLEGNDNNRYAHSLLSQCQALQDLHRFAEADSLWALVSLYSTATDTVFAARRHETRGAYFYEQQQYDSALMYFLQAAGYSHGEENLCYDYMGIMQSYTRLQQESLAYPYAEYIVSNSKTPNYCINAYYTLIGKAKSEGNAELTAAYAYRRQDYNNMLATQCERHTQAIVKLQAYIATPHPFRPWKIWLTITLICCAGLSGIAYLSHWYRKKRLKQKDILLREKDNLLSQQAQLLQYYQNTTQELSETIRTDRTAEVLEHIAHLQSLYPQPEKSWLDYPTLLKAISPTLLSFCNHLHRLQLSEKEITLCVYTLLYDKTPLNQLANHLCYSPSSIRTIKQRIGKKLGLKDASALYQFLIDLAIIGTPIRS